MNGLRLKLFLVTLLIILPATPAYMEAETGVEQSLQTFSKDISVGNFLINLTIDRYFGYVKQYVYRDIQVTSTRFFKEDEVYQCLMYDIIPPDEKAMIRFEDWWPGMTFTTIPSVDVRQPSQLRSIVEVNYTVSYRLKVVKRYIVYRDKLYFDVEYIFRNEFGEPVTLNYSDPTYGFGREVSFAIELSSTFRGSADNDLQVYRFLAYGGVREKTSIKEPYVDPSGVKYVALVSNRGDYAIPQALILIPLNVTETYGVLLDTSTMGGKISSSIVRLEMKPFTIPPNGVQRFVFRAYMGPLSMPVLEELGMPELSGALVTYTLGLLDLSVVDIPEYKPPPHSVRINIAIADPGFYPNATISVYRLTEDRLIPIRENATLKPEVIRDLEEGYYIIRIHPKRGRTVNEKAFYRNVKINGQPVEKEVVIPVFKDTEINVSYDVVRMIRLLITVIDENYRKIGGEKVSKLKITIVSKTTGHRMDVSLSQDMVLVVDEDVYEVYIDRELDGRILTDVYLRALRIVHRVSTADGKNVCVFTIDLRGPFEHGDIIIRYGGGTSAGVDPFVMFFVISVIALAVAVIAVVTFIAIRGRR